MCKISEKVRGFTLIELMLVVIIIGILVAMIVPRMAGRSEQARAAVAQADVDLNIATALKLYEIDNGAFPTTDEGLQALLAAPPSAKNWKGPYLEKNPVDPWGNPYQYKSPGTHRPHDYDLWSNGKSGTEGADTIGNWQKQQS
jgi:general secretion pathway protein G